MYAILLAAGSGKRLYPYTKKIPKCMLDVGGKPIICHQTDKLLKCGIHNIVVVTGHGSDKLKSACGQDIAYIHNKEYDTTNSLYSLWLAREFAQNGCLIFNADVLFHINILRKLIESEYQDCIVVDLNQGDDEEAMKVKVFDHRVISISKELKRGEYQGENLGLIKLSAGGAKFLFEKINEIISKGIVRAWVPYSIDYIAKEYKINVISTDGLPWIEIDFIEDLELAREKIFPQLDKNT